MKPIEIACRHTDRDGTNCGAEAGAICDWSACRPVCVNGSKWPEFHAERIEDAAACSSTEGEPAAADFDQAVENSGLV
jgi:hypothetical protein